MSELQLMIFILFLEYKTFIEVIISLMMLLLIIFCGSFLSKLQRGTNERQESVHKG